MHFLTAWLQQSIAGTPSSSECTKWTNISISRIAQEQDCDDVLLTLVNILSSESTRPVSLHLSEQYLCKMLNATLCMNVLFGLAPRLVTSTNNKQPFISHSGSPSVSRLLKREARLWKYFAYDLLQVLFEGWILDGRRRGSRTSWLLVVAFRPSCQSVRYLIYLFRYQSLSIRLLKVSRGSFPRTTDNG